VSDFILLPDFSIFETASLARQTGNNDDSCLKLFLSAWTHMIDKRDKVIVISPELNRQLNESHYKSHKQKRQALFSVVRVYQNEVDCEREMTQMRLASILSIEEDKDVYFVTDNEKMRDYTTKYSFKTISSKDAINLF
jgi:hypothetical protein